jgi:thiopurine S-methyltransferase
MVLGVNGVDMDKAFWLERWRSNLIGFHEGEVNSHLQAFWGRLALAPASRVLVPLCGKTRDLLWLRAQGHEVLGVEWSHIAVRDFFSENRLTPRIDRAGAFEDWSSDGITLRCGDFFDLDAVDLGAVDAVYDRASLIALPPRSRQDYADHLLHVLPAGVPMLLITLEYDQAAMSGPPFAVPEAEVRELYDRHRKIGLLYDRDILMESPKFRARGVPFLREKVYLLEAVGDDGH